MKGSNELVLNQATMIEAVQLWLDSQMREGLSPKVNTVKACTSNSYDSGSTFTVSLTDRSPT